MKKIFIFLITYLALVKTTEEEKPLIWPLPHKLEYGEKSNSI